MVDSYQDPLVTLLDYIFEVRWLNHYPASVCVNETLRLQVSDAEVAIASDDDLQGIVVRIYSASFSAESEHILRL